MRAREFLQLSWLSSPRNVFHQHHHNNIFIISQSRVNPLAPQLAALIEAGQDHQWNKKKIRTKKNVHTKNYVQINKSK